MHKKNILFFTCSSSHGIVDLDKEFEETIVNSAVFLLCVTMQINNFIVNYHVSQCHVMYVIYKVVFTVLHCIDYVDFSLLSRESLL